MWQSWSVADIGEGELQASDERWAAVLDMVPWIGDDRRRELRLAVHELIVNVFRHAYRADAGSIDIAATASDVAITVRIADDGDAFAQPPRAPVPGEGGYGMLIIERAFDDVAYRRSGARNHWVLCAYPRVDGT